MLPLETCSGCTACAAVCPRQCIKMVPDRDGFLYPHIQEDLCVRCGMCQRTCPVLNSRPITEQLPAAFAAKHINEDSRLRSSSGGVFPALAELIIAQEGIVYGAGFSEDLQVVHMAGENLAEMEKLRGSKYVSSHLGNTFQQVRQQLRTGRPVLFSGTPCQVEGLLAYLGRPYDNLVTVDLICHGVPSAKVWKAYLADREADSASRAESASFRSKDTGWKNFSMKLTFFNGRIYRAPMREDTYLHAFLDNLSLRPSCYACAFKTKHRSSDLTLADFWGIQQLLPQEDDNKGTSLVLVHSEKGHMLLEQIRNQVTIVRTDANAAINRNSAMIASVEPHHFRQYFFHMLGKVPFGRLVNSCFHPSRPVRLHRMLLIKISALLQKKAEKNGKKQK